MAPELDAPMPLGPLEQRVMDALWEAGPVTPGEVLAMLNAAGATPLAYTTVTTILVRLAEKGYVERRSAGRRFAYRALVGPDELDGVAGRRALDKLLRRYGADNVARFAADLLPLDHELRRRLRTLAEEEEPR